MTVEAIPLPIGTDLCCGCCGDGFLTWEGYIDQGQDCGFGICKGCQQWAEERNLELLDDARAKIRPALNEANQAKWDSFDEDKQRHIAFRLIEKGAIGWAIGGTQ